MAFERLKAFLRGERTPDELPDFVEPEEPKLDIRERRSAFSSTHLPFGPKGLRKPLVDIELKLPEFTPVALASGESQEGATFDSALESVGMDSHSLKQAFTLGQGAIPDTLFNWFSQQTFIGYQACAIISQQWLVYKALSLPAKDAVRTGYQLGSVDGEEIPIDVLAQIQQSDKDLKLPQNLVEYATNVRRFGIRIAIFIVESDDEDYYLKPFNIDGVKPGTYKGISQVDPSWTAPMLDEQAAANPASINFYEPTYWMVSGQRYHHTHLVISRYAEPADVLKPTYQYGGIPLTQMILERVYQAERTANEGSMLAETKRLNVMFMDVASMVANPQDFADRMELLIEFRNNYGVHVMGVDDKFEQIETSLTDLDSVIMNQYQLVAAEAEIPATKLLGTSPKGFNATGEFEFKSYHELLEGIQIDLTRVVERHHDLTIKSLELGDVSVVVVWNPVSSPNAKEQAEINLLNAQTYSALELSGSIDARDIRKMLIADPKSGFAGLEDFDSMEEFEDEDSEFGDLDGPGVKAPGASAPPAAEAEVEKDVEEPDEEVEEETGEDSGVLGYVKISPSLETGAWLHEWAVKAGIRNPTRAADYHATLAYSRAGIPSYRAKPDEVYALRPTGEIGMLSNALVLFLTSPKLVKRQKELKAQGAGSDFHEFTPHITIKYNPDPGDLEKAIEAYKLRPVGKIEMSGEIRQVSE